ncbi:MAG: glycosyltransferase 87 family protein [Bdellovibrionota bacterium]|jgi:hypothetical protein
MLKQLFFFFSISLLIGLLLFNNLNGRGGYDFLQYWTAGRLLAERKNPYDSTEQIRIQDATWHGEEIPRPIKIWNPPTALTYSYFFGIPTFDHAYYAWIVVTIFIILISLSLLNCVFPLSLHSPILRLAVFTFFCTFRPFITSIVAGQISPLLLLGLSLSIFFQHSNKFFLSSLFLTLTTLKPHLLYLYYPLWLLNFRKNLSKIIAGAVVGILLLIAIPLYFKPDIFQIYLKVISTPPSTKWITPTISSWLQIFSDNRYSATPFLPALITLILISGITLKQKKLPKSLISSIIPLSLLTAPYGWGSDQVLLVPSLMLLFHNMLILYKHNLYKRTVLATLITLITLNIASIILSKTLQDHYFIFQPLVVLFFSVLFLRLKDKNRLLYENIE